MTSVGADNLSGSAVTHAAGPPLLHLQRHERADSSERAQAWRGQSFSVPGSFYARGTVHPPIIGSGPKAPVASSFLRLNVGTHPAGELNLFPKIRGARAARCLGSKVRIGSKAEVMAPT